MNEKPSEALQQVKADLHQKAREVSEHFGGAPVVVVVGGSSEHGIEATMTGWSNLVEGREGRFRDILGILESAIQIESFLHYMEDECFQDLKDKVAERSWWSRGGGNPDATDNG